MPRRGYAGWRESILFLKVFALSVPSTYGFHVSFNQAIGTSMRQQRPIRPAALLLMGLLASGAGTAGPLFELLGGDRAARLYAKQCAVCHGDDLGGAAQGPALVGAPLRRGDSVAELERSIADGSPELGMPAWAGTLEADRIKSLAILVAERRRNFSDDDFRMDKQLALPAGPVAAERATFRLEVVATGIDPYPFSIAPLPSGDILLTEKKRGLSIVHPDGTRSVPIAGAPETSDKGNIRGGLDYGIGWHLDVKPHPNYRENGWVYLHHTDLCTDCRRRKMLGFFAKSMNRLVRGRIEGGRWVDQEVIWSAPEKFYHPNPDLAAGGRIAFDNNGHVYLSVGIKRGDKGVQDLGSPYGKIHRVRDDGTIPPDNPFVDTPGALPSVWSYGHRNPQGLEFDPRTGSLWSTEMGPRGGDEINRIERGKNYGWPLHSLGMNYDGNPVGPKRGRGVDLSRIQRPVVDLTPSPAVSSFVIYAGHAFPGWRGDFLVGSLKATELYRIEIDGGRHVRTEVLLTDLARIRDVEVGPEGWLYLLLEHATGGQIVRLVPASGPPD